MPARKRAFSESDATAAAFPQQPRKRRHLPLTKANLLRLQHHQHSSIHAPSPPETPQSAVDAESVGDEDYDYNYDENDDMPSPSRSSSPTRNSDERTKLNAYQIYIDRHHAFPPSLAAHIENVVHKPRDTPPSPNAKQIVARRELASGQNERGAINLLGPYLLFKGAIEDDSRVRAIPLAYTKEEINLNPSFLPPPPPGVAKGYGPLTRPRPDTAMGYLTRLDAQADLVNDIQVPFDVLEEACFSKYSLNTYLHHPFLTSQWKTENSTRTHKEAQNQAARDGACIVNFNYDFLRQAYGTAPSESDACHFSLTTDTATGFIWVHWKEGNDEGGFQHYMEYIHEFSLRHEDQVATARRLLCNIVDHAVGPRLDKIKAAIKASYETVLSGFRLPASTSRKATSASESQRSTALSETLQAFVLPPPSPISTASAPDPKKRKMNADGDVLD